MTSSTQSLYAGHRFPPELISYSRARELAADVAALTSDYPGLPRFAKAAAGLVTMPVSSTFSSTPCAE